MAGQVTIGVGRGAVVGERVTVLKLADAGGLFGGGGGSFALVPMTLSFRLVR